MHSYIYQIGLKPFDKGEALDSENILEGNDVYFSYAYDLDSEERHKAIEDIVINVLPKGMFTLNADKTLTYNGGFRIWRKSYFDSIMSAAKTLTPANVMDEYGNINTLNKKITNPLNTACLFVCGGICAEKSIKLMRIVEGLDKGDILYIGSVLGYHN